MAFTKPDNKPLLMLTIKRLTIFFSVMSSTFLFLYVIGSIQGFLDSTQTNLLTGLSFFALVSACVSLYGCVADLWFALKRHYAGCLSGAGVYGGFVVVFAGLSLAALFILSLVSGKVG